MMIMRAKANNLLSLLLIILVSFFSACSDDYTPKPRGYHRIELPEHSYNKFDENCPFTFEYSKHSKLDYKRIDTNRNPCWMNILYPKFKARVYVSYFGEHVEDSLRQLTEDSRDLVMKHIVKANDIEESLITKREDDVYGISYDFKGSTASNYQFFITDSTDHYLHASLYFETAPKPDSIAPVEQFVKEDIEHFIRSFEWK
ncbi:MAG: gliding motility lipoprotein GldD [Salibacter sp.]|uniref:gliding motility lipoprotein GldD n=2 Tax=Salibacter sp. TaxID=2010995 RepID=UPI0028708525|nr:gliding motility lipoprotein GldD [Salibacter sp.]MDR9399047.1 gliding motility lipoprotein GldD [Salibacter sp.]